MSHYSMTNDRTTYSNVVHFRTAHVEHKWILSRCNKRKMHCMYNHVKEDTDTTYLMPHQCGDWWGLFVKLRNISAKLYHNTHTTPTYRWCTGNTTYPHCQVQLQQYMGAHTYSVLTKLTNESSYMRSWTAHQWHCQMNHWNMAMGWKGGISPWWYCGSNDDNGDSERGVTYTYSTDCAPYATSSAWYMVQAGQIGGILGWLLHHWMWIQTATWLGW
jgi:hypothetical protein